MVTPPPDKSWQNAPPLSAIAATQQGGTRGAQVFGVTTSYQLITNFQEAPGGTWAGWLPMPLPPNASGVLQVAAAQQNDGRCQLWATDNSQQLWTMWQTAPGGGRPGWAGPDSNHAAQVAQSAARQQGGPRGA